MTSLFFVGVGSMKIVSWCYLLYPLTSLCWMCMALTATTLKSNLTRAERLSQQIIMRRKQMEAKWMSFIQKIDSEDDINLLAAVGSPLPPDVRPVTGPFGPRGRPAVEFTPQSYVGRWARDLLPIPFYYNFGMKVTLYVQEIKGGVLFSILESDHSQMKLGLSILRVGRDSQCVELIYRNDRQMGSTQMSATFILPKFTKTWAVFSITVRGQVVTLFFNGCNKMYSKVFQEKRAPLRILPTDPIFVGMAGWYIEKPSFFGALYDLTIYKDVNKAIPLCVKEKQAEYELVNFQENSHTQRHQVDRGDETVVVNTSTDDDTTTNKIVEGLKRIQSKQDDNIDPSSGKRKGGALVNPFEENNKAKREPKHEDSSSDGAAFNPLAEHDDDKDENENEDDTHVVSNVDTTPKPMTDGVVTTTVDNTNDVRETSVSSNGDTSSNNNSQEDISSKSSDPRNEDNNDSSDLEEGEEKEEEEEEEEEEESDTSINGSDNPSATHKRGELSKPLAGTDSPEKTAKQDVYTPTTTSSTVDYISTEMHTEASSTAAEVLTSEYRETTDAVTTVPPTRETSNAYSTSRRGDITSTRTPSPRLTLPNSKTTSTNIPQTIQKLKTKKHRTSDEVEMKKTLRSNTQHVVLTTTDTTSVTKPSTMTTTSTPPSTNEMEESRNRFSTNSLRKTLFNKLTDLMQSQQTVTITTDGTTTTETLINVVPTTQIIKLAKTLSNTKIKELLPKISYSVNRDLENRTNHPIVITRPVITNKPLSTLRTITKRREVTVEARARDSISSTDINNKEVINELDSNNPASFAQSTTNMAETVSTTVNIISLNEKMNRNNRLKTLKALTEKLKKAKSTTLPLTTTPYPHVEINDVAKDITTSTATTGIRKHTLDVTPPPSVEDEETLDSNEEATVEVIPTVATTTSRSTTKMTSPTIEMERIPEPTKVKGEFGGTEEDQKYEGLTVDDITRHVINKLKSNKKENGDLLRDEERIREIARQVLQELKVSGKLYECDDSKMPVAFIKGEKGEKGNSIKGTPGRTGLPGVIGLRGPAGERGPLGPPGRDGADGRPGLTGLKGGRGLKGEPGEMGLPGLPQVSVEENEARNERILEYGGDRKRKSKRIKHEKKIRTDEDLGIFPPQGGNGIAAKALIIYTMQDLFMMTEMFPIGSFVFVTASSELYIRGINGWMQVPTVLLSDSAAGYLSPPVAHKIQAQVKASPRPVDRMLIEGYLVLPPAGIHVPRPYLLMVALNQPLSGQMAGSIEADYMCLKQAKTIGLDGATFRAFLSSDIMAVKYLVESKYSRLPIANFKGEMLFTSIYSIFNTSGYAAFNPDIPLISFDVRDVRHDEKWPIKKIWHGSHANGEVNHKGYNCDNWRTSSSEARATAASITTYTPALNEEVMNCDKELIVLCIQTKLT